MDEENEENRVDNSIYDDTWYGLVTCGDIRFGVMRCYAVWYYDVSQGKGIFL